MRRAPVKQPWHTFPFWFFIFSGVGLTIAWQLEVLPGMSPKGVSTAQVDRPDEIELGASAAVATLDDPAEEAIFGGQSEPTPAPALAGSEHPVLPPPIDAPAAVVSLTSELADSLPAAPSVPDASNPFSAAAPSFHSTGIGSVATKEMREPGAIRTASVDALDDTSEPVTPAAAMGRKQDGLTLASIETVENAGPGAFDFSEIDALLREGRDVDANSELSKLYWKRPELRPQLVSRLKPLSHRIYFLGDQHYMDPYEVQPGDVLQTIAKGYHVPWQYLAKLNRTQPERIRPGQTLKVIQGPFGAVVDLSDLELTVHAHGHFVAVFPIGLGQDGPSPSGKRMVKEKLTDPTYYGRDGVVGHDDPKNPLGEHWLDLGDGFGIHGTPDASLVGKAEGHGGIRLREAEAAAVYDLLGIGSEVVIRP